MVCPYTADLPAVGGVPAFSHIFHIQFPVFNCLDAAGFAVVAEVQDEGADAVNWSACVDTLQLEIGAEGTDVMSALG